MKKKPTKAKAKAKALAVRPMSHDAAMLMLVRIASAAIYMQPRFKETELFRQFAESEAGHLLRGKSAKVDEALSDTHVELVRLGIVAISDKAAETLRNASLPTMKAALKVYLDMMERGEMRSMLDRVPQYQEARNLYQSL